MPTGIYVRKVRSNYPVNWYHGKHPDVSISGKQKTKLPPLEILQWMFRYNSDTGKLFKVRESSGKVCEPEREVITIGANGYLQVSITDSRGSKKVFKAHQICYFMHTGIEPLQIVDHHDGITINNRFSNLRLTTQVGNNRNAKINRKNTSGYVGVSWHKRSSKWSAQIKINGKNKAIGYYDTPEAANAARLNYVGKWNLQNIGEAFSYRHTNGDDTPPNGTTPVDVNQE